MKKKIVYVTLALALIAGAFLIGKNMPNKYNYLNLNKVTSVTQTQNGNNITIYTDTDCYDFTITK